MLRHATDGLALAGADGVRQALAAAGREGRLLLLLDGFDEVPRERRPGVRRLLAHLARDPAWSSCPLVVSSRPIGGDVLDDLPRLELLPLDESRRREFLEKWFRHAGAGGQARADAAFEHVTATRALRELSGIPLYLTLLAVLWQQGVRPAGRLAALYDQIFELLLDGRHRRDPRPMPIQDEVREALTHLAHGMTEDDRWAEPVKRLERRLRARHLEHLRRRLGTVEAWRQDLYAFLRDVRERTQILGPHDGRHGDWRFWHRTFREALAAERLHQQHRESGPAALVDWARQLEDGGEGRWAEPLALLAGRLEGADDLVERLGEANPKLAVRAAVFAQGLKPETVRSTLQLTGNLEERARVFESIPDQLGDAGACLAFVEQLKEGLRDGFDLFWLWWIVEQVERRWPDQRARDLLGRFFDHIPPPAEAQLFRTLDSPLDGRVPLWCEIPAGEAWVGSPRGEEGRDGDEGPRHQVEILEPYRLGAGPVTNAQYHAFDPGKAFENWPGVPADQLPAHPRVGVTWYEATSFCRWLATLPGFAGTGPRLPLEEEWEVACRAGTETRYWSGDGESDLAQVGWYAENADGRTHRVGAKPGNPFQLYDLHGNVWEWCASPWDKKRYQARAKDEPFRIDPAEHRPVLPGTPPGHPASGAWCAAAAAGTRHAGAGPRTGSWGTRGSASGTRASGCCCPPSPAGLRG